MTMSAIADPGHEVSAADPVELPEIPRERLSGRARRPAVRGRPPEGTRAYLLSHASALLHEEGPRGLSYAALARRATASRQTLYRFWSTPTDLVCELAATNPLTRPLGNLSPAAVGTDAREAMRTFLGALHRALEVDDVALPISLLISHAEHDPAAAQALSDLEAGLHSCAEAYLGPTGAPIDRPAFGMLAGAVLTARFITGAVITPEYLDLVVSGWQPACGRGELGQFGHS